MKGEHYKERNCSNSRVVDREEVSHERKLIRPWINQSDGEDPQITDSYSAFNEMRIELAGAIKRNERLRKRRVL